jgi:redox-sensitive bicupin YhaK (pirin superfamily)
MSHIIEGEIKDLGGFSVRRLLPAAGRKMIGPFIFFDHFGPARFEPGQGVDVRPHPHIGLATVTYLYQGAILHRDSLGSVQEILPGDVNWMIAGRGIVHSERESGAVRRQAHVQHGIQTWLALPDGDEEVDPGFSHHPANGLPRIARFDGVTMRLIAGAAYGESSPVPVFSPMFYLDVGMRAGSRLIFPDPAQETGVYLVSGHAMCGDQAVQAGQMAYFPAGPTAELIAGSECTLLLLGGEPFAGSRHIWWNFVSSSPARIEQAKRQWRDGGFDPIDGETEFIPLPD